MKVKIKLLKGVLKMNKKGIGILCLTAMLMAGCGSPMPNMSDENANAIGEYAAILLLKYDANSRSRLVDLSQVEALEEVEEKQEPSVQPQPEEPSSQAASEPESTPVTDLSVSGLETAGSLESFLDLPDGMSLVCTGHELCQSYQGEANPYFAMEAAEGKELLVLHFDLQNHSGSSQEADFLSRKDNYRVTVNGSYSRTALTTMLVDDLSTYKGTLADGVTEKVVLVFEVEPEQLGNVDSISLNLKNDTSSYMAQVL